MILVGQITKTLGEILEIPNYDLFLPHNIDHYERLKALIINRFFNREIAYDTTDYFRMRLNYYLEVNAPVYNKMLASEYVEFNPFQTEYIEESQNTSSDTTEGLMEGITAYDEKSQQSGMTNTRNNKEGYQGKSLAAVVNNQVSTDLNASLLSESVNESGDKETGEHKDYQETLDSVIDSNTEDKFHETKRVDYTSTRDTNQTDDRTTNKTDHKNQTGRQWNEQGNSNVHNLNVDSNTPQMMLFNVPNHYYGTGTPHNYGPVVTDEHGNQSYGEYLEGDLNALETEPREIDGGDTPWYNYATTAGNTLGHDSYQKSGNETYQISGDANIDDDLTREIVYNQSDTTDTETNSTRNIEKTDTRNDDTKGEHTITGNESTLFSRASNVNEHNKSDRIVQSNQQNDSKNEYAKAADLLSKTSAVLNAQERNDKNRNLFRGISNESTSNRMRTGRTGKSPSQLLLDYRETVTYSADQFMLGELENVFLQLF